MSAEVALRIGRRAGRRVGVDPLEHRGIVGEIEQPLEGVQWPRASDQAVVVLLPTQLCAEFQSVAAHHSAEIVAKLVLVLRQLRGGRFALRRTEADAVGQRQPLDLQTRDSKIDVGRVGNAVVGKAREVEAKFVECGRGNDAVIGRGGGDIERFEGEIAQRARTAGGIGGPVRERGDVGAYGNRVGGGQIVVDPAVVLIAGGASGKRNLRERDVGDAV